MTQVTVPSAGDAIATAWGQSVANHANHLIPLGMTADASTSSGSFGDVTGLSFAAVSGKAYAIRLGGTYAVGGTTTGIGIGFTGPGGSTRLFVRIYGNGSPTGVTSEVVTSSDTGTGTSTTDSTATRMWEAWGTFVCTSTGTWKLRFNRNGTSATVTIHSGSGGLVVEN